MGRKSKGISAERELIHLFWSKGYAAFRIAGSGNTKYPSVDVVAGNLNRKLAIECKTTKECVKYLSKEEISQLRLFSNIFGAEPWFAIRFDRKGWCFYCLEDFKDAKEGLKARWPSKEQGRVKFEELF